MLLGPSGCGKTTLMRMIAGLERPTSGDIVIDGRVVNDLPPRARNIAMVFQSYALYPHLTVARNISFPLRAVRMPKPEIRKKVEWAARMFGIERLLDRKPRQLSGGERQRVALARAVVREPVVFLLDEPLSNLDAKLRNSARDELKQFQRRLGTTTIYVTHDQAEAMGLGDRIAVLNQGKVRQVGTPQEIYIHPTDTFVATFIGSPPMNLIEDDAAFIGFRPEAFLPRGIETGDDNVAFPFRVNRVEYLGADRLVYGVIEGRRAGNPRDLQDTDQHSNRDRRRREIRLCGSPARHRTLRPRVRPAKERSRRVMRSPIVAAADRQHGSRIARPDGRQRALAVAADAGAGDSLHRAAGRLSVPAVALLQLVGCNRREPRDAFRRPGEFSARGRKRDVLGRAQEYGRLHRHLADSRLDIRQRPGDGAAGGFPRQVAGAAADPAPLGRADLARQRRLAVDVRFHLQRHQLDAACGPPARSAAMADLARHARPRHGVDHHRPGLAHAAAGDRHHPGGAVLDSRRTFTMRPRSTGRGSGATCSRSRCRSSCRSRWSRCCSGSFSPSPT